jgi:hypothetical protein
MTQSWDKLVTQENRDKLQKSLEQIMEWLQTKRVKCKAMHMGHGNPEYSLYYVWGCITQDKRRVTLV